jgi:2-dehydro-3-deoxy-D-gluconate 5-dehydrogenase
MTEKVYDNASFNEKLFEGLPAKRWGEAKDLAAACVYLASPASDYVSGHCIVVDGGILGGPPIVPRAAA